MKPDAFLPLKQFARRAWRSSQRFLICDGPALDTDLDEAVKTALSDTPIAGLIKGTTQLVPKIDADGYFGADFDLLLGDGASLPMEIFVHRTAIEMFFREP